MSEELQQISDPVFDPLQPHGRVWGHPGVFYSQNGHRFRKDGSYVTTEQAKAAEVKSPAEKALDREAAKEALKEEFRKRVMSGTAINIVEHKPAPATVIDENGQADNVDLDQLHWSKLKAMVEERGGKYVNKQQAAEFIRSKAVIEGINSGHDEVAEPEVTED